MVDQGPPPPNPAKLTDSRATNYIDEYGSESWELDALDPSTLADLITGAINENRDDELWAVATRKQELARTRLQQAADRWSEVEALLESA